MPTTDFYARLERALTRKLKERPTQTRIAKHLGLKSQGAVANWKAGPSLPEPRHMVELAKWAGVCVEWLWTGRGPMYPDAAEDDPFLQAAVSLLKLLPKRERSRALEMLRIKVELAGEAWPESEADAIERIKQETGKHRKLT